MNESHAKPFLLKTITSPNDLIKKMTKNRRKNIFQGYKFLFSIKIPMWETLFIIINNYLRSLFQMGVIECIEKYFFNKHISWTENGVINIDPIKGVKVSKETRHYIQKHLCFLKTLVLWYNPINNGPRNMILYWHKTTSETK